MKLRKYQEEARLAVENAWEEGSQRVMMILPTGTGKTIVFSKIAEDIITNDGINSVENGTVEGGKHVLILAHREELLKQAMDKIGRVTGLECALEKAESRAHDGNGEIRQNVVVASVDSLKDRLSEYTDDYFDTIIVDETQHATANGHRKILNYFSDAKVLGVTATPERGDASALGTCQSLSLCRAVRIQYHSIIFP